MGVACYLSNVAPYIIGLQVNYLTDMQTTSCLQQAEKGGTGEGEGRKPLSEGAAVSCEAQTHLPCHSLTREYTEVRRVPPQAASLGI